MRPTRDWCERDARRHRGYSQLGRRKRAGSAAAQGLQESYRDVPFVEARRTDEEHELRFDDAFGGRGRFRVVEEITDPLEAARRCAIFVPA